MNKFSNPKNRKGFTLVEILTVVFLGTLIIIAAYTVYIISYKAYKKNSASSELTQNARIALERITRDIRQATEIVPDVSDIKFQDGHAVSPIRYIRYYLSSDGLHREISHYCFSPCSEYVLWSTQDGEGNSPELQIESDQIKAEKITSISFSWSEKTVTVRLTVSDGTATYTFETKTLGRNTQ